MAQNYDLQLLTPNANGLTVPMVGVWVQLVNNDTGTSYVSTGITNGTGKATFAPKPPGDSYIINTSAVSNSGPWTAFGISNHTVPVIQGDSPAFQGVTTVVGGPYVSSARANSTDGLVYDRGGAVNNLQAAKYTAIGTWNPAAGTGNATQAVQTFLTDSAGLVAFAPAGTYMIGPYYQVGGTTEVCLGIPDNTTLEGVGQGTLFKLIANADNSKNLWMLMGTNNFNSGAGRINRNCNVRNVLFDGNAANQTIGVGNAHAGVVFWPVYNHFLENVVVQNVGHHVGTEGFGILVNGDTIGDDSTTTRVNGIMIGCVANNTATGIGIHSLSGEQSIACQGGNDTSWQGITVWASGTKRTRDVTIIGFLADTCNVGIELEACMGVKVIGSTSRNNQLGGIRFAPNSSGTAPQRCVVVSNEVYNNNSSNATGFQGAGIYFWRNGLGDPTDNLVAYNRCYDDQGAGQTQLYGIGMDPAMAAGSQNLVKDNDCRGNKTANTVGLGLAFGNMTQGSNLALTAVAATPAGCTTTSVLDTDCIVFINVQGVVSFDVATTETAGDYNQLDIRVDGVIKSSGGCKCKVTNVGADAISATWAGVVAAGSHTFDIQVANQTGSRGVFSKGNVTIQVQPYLQ